MAQANDYFHYTGQNTKQTISWLYNTHIAVVFKVLWNENIFLQFFYTWENDTPSIQKKFLKPQFEGWYHNRSQWVTKCHQLEAIQDWLGYS